MSKATEPRSAGRYAPAQAKLSAEDRAFVRECRREREHIVRTGKPREPKESKQRR